ncbi:MAG TPA: hypothetical protein VKT20_02410 [Candidatus Dormibacteraeota bacterium]|nr:hypothetical protein [Candidatus Dormibacteraeota bacterium]
MSSNQVGALGLGLLACLLGLGGIVFAVRRYRGRAAIASTYGQTGGIAYTVVQAGCSGVLILGGLALMVLGLVAHG